MELYRTGWDHAVGRKPLDAALDALGAGPLGVLLRRALEEGSPGERLVWVADGGLHGVPLAALRVGGRYLVESHPIVTGFGGGWLTRDPAPAHRFWGKCLVVTEGEAEGADGSPGLPAAAAEGRCVRAAFFRTVGLHAGAATRDAVSRELVRAKVVHFACHALFDPARPLAAYLRLPSGERVRAAELPDLPLNGLRLATLSACHSGRVGRALGREVFGLVTGLLAAGVRAVVAGLWSVPDTETAEFMGRFYRHRLTTDLATALARAQRESLADSSSSPLIWAVFALYGEPDALPAPGRWVRPWARRRQRRHARRFQDPGGIP